jgi:hypothetical protein
MWHLDNFSNEKLIDIVKNYKLYKYETSVKFEALEILESRGIYPEDLEIVGNETEAHNFKVKSFYTNFERNSIIAFVLYVALVVLNFFVNSYAVFFIFLSLLIAYFVSLIVSFINQKDFYKAINKPGEASGVLIYLAVGMPLYPIFFFFALKRMREHFH